MMINVRQSPRFNFQSTTWAKVLIPSQQWRDFKMYRACDISRGGFSFFINDAAELKRGDTIIVDEIEDREFEHQIVAVIRYIQCQDEFGIDFKVGCEFLVKTKRKDQEKWSEFFRS